MRPREFFTFNDRGKLIHLETLTDDPRDDRSTDEKIVPLFALLQEFFVAASAGERPVQSGVY